MLIRLKTFVLIGKHAYLTLNKKIQEIPNHTSSKKKKNYVQFRIKPGNIKIKP